MEETRPYIEPIIQPSPVQPLPYIPVIETPPPPLPVAPRLYPDLSNAPEMAETAPYLQPTSYLRQNLKKPMKRIQPVPVPLKTKVIPTLARSGQPIQNIVTKHQLQQVLAKKSCTGGKICVVQPTANPPLQPLQAPSQPPPNQGIVPISAPPVQVQLPQARASAPSSRRRGLNCGICGANFARSWNLTRHMQNIHKKEISGEIGYQKCVICNQKFGDVGELQRHIAEVHNIQDSDDSSDEEMAVPNNPPKVAAPKRDIQIEKPCSICKKSFRYRAQLNEHIKKEHPVLSDGDEEFSSWTDKNPKKRTTSAAKLTKNDPYFHKFFRGKKHNYPVWNPKEP